MFQNNFEIKNLLMPINFIEKDLMIERLLERLRILKERYKNIKSHLIMKIKHEQVFFFVPLVYNVVALVFGNSVQELNFCNQKLYPSNR